VLGLALPVASIEDILQGKMWAATDDTRQAEQAKKGSAGYRALDRKLSGTARPGSARDPRAAREYRVALRRN